MSDEELCKKEPSEDYIRYKNHIKEIGDLYMKTIFIRYKCIYPDRIYEFTIFDIDMMTGFTYFTAKIIYGYKNKIVSKERYGGSFYGELEDGFIYDTINLTEQFLIELFDRMIDDDKYEEGSVYSYYDIRNIIKKYKKG